jgi:hypothetical protein
MPERPVRIPRGPQDGRANEYSEGEEAPAVPPRSAQGVPGREASWVSNHGAIRRSVRLFLAFLIIPGLLWTFFLVLERTSSDPALRSDLIGPAAMGVIWLIIVVLGFGLTLRRTPLAFRPTDRGDLAYRTVFGSSRVQRLGEGARRVIREHYTPNLLNPTEVDLVEIVVPGLPRRLWLMESRRLEELWPRGDPDRFRPF